MVLRRALLAVLDRDFETAEKLLERAVKLDSDSVESYLALARLYRTRGEVGRGIRIHQNLLLRSELDSAHRLDALLGLADDFRKGGFLQRAIDEYQKVLSLDSKNIEAMQRLIPLLVGAREVSAALALEKRLSRLQGEEGRAARAVVLVQLAEVAREEGRVSEARRAVKRALKSDPECVSAWITQGDIDAQRGKGKAAIASWEKVPYLDLRKGSSVYDRLKMAWSEMNHLEQYETYLRAVLEKFPGDKAASLALVELFHFRGDLDGAIRELRDFLKGHPSNLEAHGVYGRLLIEAGRTEEIPDEYEKLVSLLDKRGLLHSRESSL
ncbi:MAG: tetratricopeptide repeat protein [Deltaproteobacteria bacterium]|nr:tetratricopeptide repeat protein [Deltaproteobacteria bacterium]